MTFALCGFAWASGDGGPLDDFVSRDRPGIDFDKYEAGSLGILLPTYPRVFLYPAWRAILLGQEELQKEPVKAGALGKACCSTANDWINERDPESASAKWLAVRAKIAPTAPRVPLAVMRETKAGAYDYYRNCPDAAFAFAQSTLLQLGKRPDATPARLKDWVAAQDATFGFCGYVEGAKPRYNQPPAPKPEFPGILSKQEPLAWRQWRDYQIAAAWFYSGDNEKAASLFDAIGKEAGHPMQKWGAYLSMRAQIRAISFMKSADSGKLAGLEAASQRILGNAALAELYEPVKASMRTARFRLTPEKQFQELSATLNDWKKNPHIDDTLGDWRRLANDLLEDRKEAAELASTMRAKYDYFDWMRTIQRCDGTLPERKNVSITCADERAHALNKWRDTRKSAPRESRAWFVAVMMTADRLESEVQQQAAGIPETAPEFLTVRYYTIRLLRQSGKAAEARKLADDQLKRPADSTSTLNLLRQERFALATDLADATQFLTRTAIGERNPDTQESKPAAKPVESIAADGSNWLNNSLSIADLLKLADNEKLSPSLRKRIAIAAWSRAELLGKADYSSAAAKKVEMLAPELKTSTDDYARAVDPMMRRHVLLRAGIKNGVSPVIDWRNEAASAPRSVPLEEMRAGMWCKLGKSEEIENFRYERSPPAPEVSGDAKTRNSEIAALRELRSATGFFSSHMLAYGTAHPEDPEVPWLLHVAVQSSRGGCVDKDNGDMSRSVHNLLHSRYGKSEWAKKTPYWFK